jgi:glycosyltransferase involved in cell wall biosynthesis
MKLILDLASKLIKSKNNVLFSFVGQDSYGATDFKKDAYNIIGKNQCRFCGFIKDYALKELYRKSMFVILPSRYEGFGLTAIEAMSCGTIVIANDNCEAVKEIVENKAIFIKDPPTIEDVNTIIKLLEDEEAYNNFIESFREVVKKWSWDTTARKFIALFQNIVED